MLFPWDNICNTSNIFCKVTNRYVHRYDSNGFGSVGCSEFERTGDLGLLCTIVSNNK